MAVNKSQFFAVGMTVAVLISLGYIISIGDTHYCEDLMIGKECDHLSSTEKTCYPNAKDTKGKKYCSTGWLPIDVQEPYVTCDYYEKNVTYKETVCVNSTKINKNGSVDLMCSVQEVEKTQLFCKEKSEKIIYRDSILYPDKNNIKCNTAILGIFCDDKPGGDGNGDGICQSGETCYEFKLTEKIDEPIVKNGDVVKKDVTKNISISVLAVNRVVNR